jgi:adenosine deaminase
MLGRVESLTAHPIRKLFDAGIRVTVNTDDILVFGQSVSQEFLNLYRAACLDENELDQVRLNGLID